jgi:hypothetical protein
MTNEEIEKYKQELYEIQRIESDENKWKQLIVLADKLTAPAPVGLNIREKINAITQNIHIVLQTETMLNACVSAEQSSTTAKRACIWAAVAAGISLLGVIASWIMIFKK